MIDLTPVFQAAILLVISIVTTFVIPYLKNKTTEQQQTTLMRWVQVAVQAAEQIFPDSGKGQYKKKYVLEFLAGKGFMVDESAIDALIEAAVYDIKKGMVI